MSDALARKFDAAWAAVMGGVQWNPGDHDSIDGVTKDEAIEYAAEFLKAYRESNTGPVVEAAGRVTAQWSRYAAWAEDQRRLLPSMAESLDVLRREVERG